MRNDSPCGSTIGPILSANCGIRTIDIGCPQLSMHSIREMCGTDDVTHAINLLKVFASVLHPISQPPIVTEAFFPLRHSLSMLISPHWTGLWLSTNQLCASHKQQLLVLLMLHPFFFPEENEAFVFV